MVVAIRRATGHDVQGVAAVKRHVWPTEAVQYEYIAAVMNKPMHITQVAVTAERVIGFVNGFLTISAHGKRRWEVDLLAVHSEYTGRGIAVQLVQASTNAGKMMGASVARGLVGVENTASQRTFARCGYVTNGEVHALYVCTADAGVRPQPAQETHFVPVSTLNYVGLWLEGDLSYESFLAGRHICAQNHWDLVGAVIPIQDGASIQAALDAGCLLIGYYQWWRLDFQEP